MAVYGIELAEWRAMPWWPNGRVATVSAGDVGREREIVVNVEGYGCGRDEKLIPDGFVDVLTSELPETWKVESRSSRIELHPSGHYNGGWCSDDVAAVKRALTEMGLAVTVRTVEQP